MEAPPLLPKKKDILEALLSDSNVYLHLDPRRAGVVVPKWFQNQPELVLQLGLCMSVPIPDLEVDDEGVSCTLSFSRAPFWCCIPWGSIFAVVSEKDRRGVVWPDDVPADGQSAKNLKPAKPRPKLTALGPNDRLEPEPSEEAPELPPIDSDTKCGTCGTPWVEDQSTCPVCGTSAAEALRPAAATPPAARTLVAVPPPDPAVTALDAHAAKKGVGPKKRPAGPASKPKPRTRPTLAAAPPVLKEAEPQAQVSKTASGSVPAASASDKGASPFSAGPNAAKKTTKRELPPYLRVVK